jgi:hypothetical protein
MKMTKILNIIYIFLSITTSALIIESRSTTSEVNKCIENYIKSQGILGEIDGEIGAPNSLCLALVDVTKSHILENFKQEFQKERKDSDIECLVKSLRNSGFMNDALLLSFHGHLELTDDKKEKLIPETQKRVSRDVYQSFITCDGDKRFGEEFEQLFEMISSEEKMKDDEDYCVRHHIIKEGLIKVEGINFNENPKNVDSSTINCHNVYKHVLKMAENELLKAIFEEESKEVEGDELTSKQTECILNVIRSENFIDKMIPYDFVKEFTLTDEQRTQLKHDFIDIMKKLALSTEKCFI